MFIQGLFSPQVPKIKIFQTIKGYYKVLKMSQPLPLLYIFKTWIFVVQGEHADH